MTGDPKEKFSLTKSLIFLIWPIKKKKKDFSRGPVKIRDVIMGTEQNTAGISGTRLGLGFGLGLSLGFRFRVGLKVRVRVRFGDAQQKRWSH